MYKKDWLLNQIDDLVEFLAKVFLNQTTTEYLPENIVNSTSDELYNSLDRLICEKKINEAENLLFDKIEVQNPKHLAIAINFYGKLNKLPDETLEEANYSREEINQGLNDILDKFGIKIDLNKINELFFYTLKFILMLHLKSSLLQTLVLPQLYQY